MRPASGTLVRCMKFSHRTLFSLARSAFPTGLAKKSLNPFETPCILQSVECAGFYSAWMNWAKIPLTKEVYSDAKRTISRYRACCHRV